MNEEKIRVNLETKTTIMPRMELEHTDIEYIQKYVDNGFNILFCVVHNPKTKSMQSFDFGFSNADDTIWFLKQLISRMESAK